MCHNSTMGFLRNSTISVDTDTYSHGEFAMIGYIMLGLAIIWTIGCVLVSYGYCERCISQNRNQLVPLRLEICVVLLITGILYGAAFSCLLIKYT